MKHLKKFNELNEGKVKDAIQKNIEVYYDSTEERSKTLAINHISDLTKPENISFEAEQRYKVKVKDTLANSNVENAMNNLMQLK